MDRGDEVYPYTFLNKLTTQEEGISCEAFGLWALAMSWTCGKTLSEKFLDTHNFGKSKKNTNKTGKILQQLVGKKLAIKFEVDPSLTTDGSKEVYLFSQTPLSDEQIGGYYMKDPKQEEANV